MHADIKINKLNQSKTENYRPSLRKPARDWLSGGFNPQYFITLTAGIRQSKHKEPFRKLVTHFVKLLNHRIYQRKYSKDGKCLPIVYVIESHPLNKSHRHEGTSRCRNGTCHCHDIRYHCHMIIGQLDGSEYLQNRSLEQIIKYIWKNKMRHDNHYALVDVQVVFDPVGVYDYINKENKSFDFDFFELPR